jgi:hypothetical protein
MQATTSIEWFNLEFDRRTIIVDDKAGSGLAVESAIHSR